MSEEDDRGGPDLGGMLGQKVGPLPLGVWIAAVVGGIGIAYVVRRRGEDEEPAEPYVPDGTVIGQPNGVGQDGGDDDEPADDLDVDPQTNEQWGRMAIRRMMARGYDPSLVDSAVRNYLAGETLSVTERALIAETLVVVGPPPVPPPPEIPGGTKPDPIKPIPVPKPRPDPPAPGPKPKPRPIPPRPTVPPYRVVTVTRSGQSLSSLVADYNRRYKTHHTWEAVWAFNLKWRDTGTRRELERRGPHRVYRGTKFWIPK